ncbi:MAG: glycoside hydrolase family 97 catalytic domain-containing protein, partial [Segatella copri]|nr:glycoside hydrolase family 97 catalytic domain-containing protein [Segatella copri]
ESYENFFPLSTTGKGGKQHWGYPCLLEQNGVYSLITEAGIERINSASSLKNGQNPEDYHVFLDENTQHYSGNWKSPWRVVVIGKKQDLIASTLVTDVSAPCRLKDTSWIKPGSVSWIYWAYNHGSNDLNIIKKYVDMAKTLHLPYVLIDAEWDEMKNGATIEEALKYAKDRGVKPLLWYNSSTAWIKAWGAPGPHNRLNAPENREKEFAWLEKMGVAGVKIDFFAGDKQETMEYCIDLLECAARHHLTVNFHGATVPRGWQRTYPNLLSTEGVYGAEWYNNESVLTKKAACHNATLPFTRGIVGSMDYTPCTFSDSQHPHITTHAHELALPILFESALMHWADKPESYLAQPKEVQDFISNMPTAWDETRLLSGYPGESVVMARRKGSTWYVAGINGKDESQKLALNLSSLTKQNSRVVLFEDSGTAKNPWKISYRKVRGMKDYINAQPRGGFVMVIKSKKRFAPNKVRSVFLECIECII